MPPFVFTVPNSFSFLRILLAPILFTAGLMGNEPLFLGCFAGALLSDFLDGFLARLLDQQTKFGSQLDTIGDVLTAVIVLLSGILLWPDKIQDQSVWILAAVVVLCLSGSVTLLRYKHLPSYHTWSAKLSTAVAGVGVWLFFADVTVWGFRLGIIILIFSALEEVAITFILPQWQPNIPHVFHALKMRKQAKLA